jgi:hypothetical protein
MKNVLTLHFNSTKTLDAQQVFNIMAAISAQIEEPTDLQGQDEDYETSDLTFHFEDDTQVVTEYDYWEK